MSGAVGSSPSFIRRGLPAFALRSNFARRSSSRIRSIVPFFRNVICSSMVIHENRNYNLRNILHELAKIIGLVRRIISVLWSKLFQITDFQSTIAELVVLILEKILS